MKAKKAAKLTVKNSEKHPSLLTKGRVKATLKYIYQLVEFAARVEKRPMLHESSLAGLMTGMTPKQRDKLIIALNNKGYTVDVMNNANRKARTIKNIDWANTEKH